MIASLVRELGLKAADVLAPEPGLFLEHRSSSFKVFHVAEALKSPMVPAQESFVVPFAIRSVIGFGGTLPNGEIFAMILFSKVHINLETAQLFKAPSLSLKLAITTHADRVFA